MVHPAPSSDAGDEEVLVSPRYLAGPNSAEAVRAALDNAPDWTQVAVGPDAYYTSPCQRLRAAHSPEAGWTFAYAADPLGVPTWITTFDRETPDEIVSAFTDTLVDGMPNYFRDYLKGGQHYTGQTPARVFTEHGWEAGRGSRPWRTLSPDGHAAFHIRSGRLDEDEELRAPESATWKMSAGPDPAARPSWMACFTGNTPQPLMTAVAGTLTDPRPVMRPAYRVPERHRALVDLQPTPTATPRTAAAQARSPHASASPTAQPAPLPAPATRPASARPSRQR